MRVGIFIGQFDKLGSDDFARTAPGCKAIDYNEAGVADGLSVLLFANGDLAGDLSSWEGRKNVRWYQEAADGDGKDYAYSVMLWTPILRFVCWKDRSCLIGVVALVVGVLRGESNFFDTASNVLTGDATMKI